MTCPIVFASDAAYAMPLATALRSLADSNRAHWPLDVRVLHDGIAPALRERIEGSLPPGAATVAWLEIDLAPYAMLLTMPGISKMTFARLAIPELMPLDVERLLYLDADTLILGDIGPLLGASLQGAAFGAVIDGIDPFVKQGDPRCAGVPRVGGYFNAGMLLVDLPRWRAQRVSERALEFLRTHPDTPFADQDALNVAGDGRWEPLDPSWNFQGHRDECIDSLGAATRPSIVHFITGAKPWRAKSLNLNGRLYDAFRRRTTFPRTARERAGDAIVSTLSRLNRHLKRYAWWRRLRERARDPSRLTRPTTP